MAKPQGSGWRLGSERPEVVFVFLVGSALIFLLAFWPVSAQVRAQVLVDRVGFVYEDEATESLPKRLTGSAPMIEGFSEIIFPAARRADAPESTPLAAIRISAARPDSRIVFSDGEVEWARMPRGTQVTLTRIDEADGAHLNLAVVAQTVALNVTTPGPATIECQHCVLHDNYGAQSSPDAAVSFQIKGASSTTAEIIGNKGGLAVDVRLGPAFEWTGFKARAFSFLDNRPIEPGSTVRGKGMFTLSGLGSSSSDTPIPATEHLQFVTNEFLTVRTLTAPADGLMSMLVVGPVDAVMIGNERHSASLVDLVKRSRLWVAIGAALAFGLGVLNLFDKLKLRVTPPKEPQP